MRRLYPIRIANKRTDAPQLGGVYIGRPSPLGNPFVIGRDGNSATVIAKYRTWLEQQRPLWLVCWCAPLPCHGDVIAATLRELADGRRTK